MHKEILSAQQIELLPLIKRFSAEFVLVGGTAIALYLGHRRSIDFDLFTFKSFNAEKIRNSVRNHHEITQTLVENPDELTIVANEVKLTFYKYPFRVDFAEAFEDVVKMPSLITLSAMKAFALGRRAKWKDYVDLYFLFNQSAFQKTVEEASKIFGDEFNEKLFRTQLAYFNDVDYSDQVEYMPGFDVTPEKIKSFLTEVSIK